MHGSTLSSSVSADIDNASKVVSHKYLYQKRKLNLVLPKSHAHAWYNIFILSFCRFWGSVLNPIIPCTCMSLAILEPIVSWSLNFFQGIFWSFFRSTSVKLIPPNLQSSFSDSNQLLNIYNLVPKLLKHPFTSIFCSFFQFHFQSLYFT